MPHERAKNIRSEFKTIDKKSFRDAHSRENLRTCFSFNSNR